MEPANAILQWLQSIGFVAVALWALLRWVRRGDTSSGWLGTTFGALGGVVVISAVLDAVPDTAAGEVLGRLIVPVLLLFPYLLLRFVDTLEAVPVTMRRTVGIVVGALALVGLVVQGPEAGEPRSPAFTALVVLGVGTWLVVLPFVSVRLWRAGRLQPTVARRRLRLLAGAVILLSLAILLIGATEDAAEATTFVIRSITVAAAALFVVGFMPPPALRRLWRQREEDELHAAALRLFAVTDAHEVAEVLTPHLRSVVAARGVALVHDGRLLGSEGITDEEADAAVHAEPEGAITSSLSNGRIVVWVDRYTPFFGEEELALFERVGLLADLALERAALLVSERETRAALEHANAELESFVYSASHDLKSPLIAMLGYVDLLMEDHREQLGEDGRWYLDRMATNGRYMEALIRDLLELSRVGRMQTEVERVELDRLLEEVVAELGSQHAGLRVEVGPMPVLHVNGVRARQLFTNLLDNAARYGDPAGTTVAITAQPAAQEPGGVVVSVRDDGPGVPEPYRELVFGVFERLANDEEQPGTGMGLAICRKIMEGAGGRIWLADRDDGAEFCLLFPSSAVAAGVGSINEEVPA